MLGNCSHGAFATFTEFRMTKQRMHHTYAIIEYLGSRGTVREDCHRRGQRLPISGSRSRLVAPRGSYGSRKSGSALSEVTAETRGKRTRSLPKKSFSVASHDLFNRLERTYVKTQSRNPRHQTIRRGNN